MDLQQFLAQGPLQYLLVLMIVPVLSALLLVAYIVFTFSRRNKKSKMKLGTEPKKKVEPSTMNDGTAGTVPTEIRTSDSDEIRVDVLGQHANRISQSGQETPSPIAEEPIDLSTRLGTVLPKPSPLSRPEEPAEMLRLLRQPQTGQLLVEIAGQRYTRLADITDRNIGRLVLQLAAHLLVFTSGNIFTQDGIKSFYRPKVDSLAQPPSDGTSMKPSVVTGSASQVQPASPEAEAKFQASLQSEEVNSPLGQSGARHHELQAFWEQPASTAPAVGVSGLDLAHEINKIVKEELTRSPLASTTRIEIASNPDGSLRIIVNNQSYGAPDDIPDEAARTLIKRSIEEWERR